MGKKKKDCPPTCDHRCIYFSTDPEEILEEKIVNGVKQRTVVRRCLYDLSRINTWSKVCPRENGPCFPRELLKEMREEEG